MSNTLTETEITDRLSAYDGWGLEGSWLEKTFEHEDFTAALAFVNRIGEIAEDLNHHPDITIQNYNEVKIRVQSHDVDGITDRDLTLVKRIEAL